MLSIIILRRDVPGSAALGGVLLSTFVWSGAYAVSWSLVELDAKLFWVKIMYLGVIAVPVLFLIFILRITHYENWLTSRNLLFLCVQPLVMLMILWFGPQLVFAQAEVERIGGF